MITSIKKFKELPFELDKVYQTRFQTKEKFLLKRIVWNKERIFRFEGIFESSPNLGIVPLGSDRLIADIIEECEEKCCNNCGEKI